MKINALRLMAAAGMMGVVMVPSAAFADYGTTPSTICTVSDHIRTGEQTTAEERQLTFNDMIEIALDSVLLGDK